jgi:(2Fe-2S) ferredoxin
MPVPRMHWIVCTNDRGAQSTKPCCAHRNGLAVYQKLKDLVRERGLKEEVLVTRSGCLRHCSRGVTVAVWPSNHWYGGVRAEDVALLLEAELAGEHASICSMPEGPWE